MSEIGHVDGHDDLSTPRDDVQVEPGAVPWDDRAQSPDHPELAFVQAAGYTVGRPDGPPIWIVIHDMEASETTTRAESTAVYFSDPPDGRNVSSHYCADSNSIVQCVRLRDSAWTVGNRPGNNRGINWELAGFASQTHAQWLDPYGVAMLNLIVPIIQADAAKYRIPLQRRTVAELRAWVPGITSHNDLRLAFGGTTHTDPGANFPWDYFIDLLNQEGEMGSESPETRIHAFNTDSYLYRLHTRNKEVPYVGVDDSLWTGATFDSLFLEAFDQLIADVAALKARPPVQPAPVDAAALAAALAADDAFLDAIATRVSNLLTPEVRDAVADLGEGGAAKVRADAVD